MTPTFTRRRVLALGAAGISPLAGCTYAGTLRDGKGTPPSYEEDPRNTDDTANDGPTNQPPETAAVEIHKRNGTSNYSFRDIPRYQSVVRSESGTVEWLNYLHPDNRVIDVEVTDIDVSITVDSMKLNRAIILRLHHPAQDGSMRVQRRQVSPESDGFQTYTWKFDLGDTSLPTLTENLFRVTVEDTSPGYNAERLLTIHRHMAIPYGNGSIHHLNARALQHKIHTTNGQFRMDRPARYYSDHVDYDGKRTRFFAIYPNARFTDAINASEKLYGAASTVNESDYQEYQRNKRNNDYRGSHRPDTYAYNASNFTYLTEFANTFVTSLRNHGITDHFAKLQLLNFLVGAMTYKVETPQGPQLNTVWQGDGDCTEHTFLYLGLLNTPAFDNTRACYIHCDLDLNTVVSHMVVGIDERDIGNPTNPEEIRWVEPTEKEKQGGIPDTRYAFTELTAISPIGNSNKAAKIYGIFDTINCDRFPEHRSF